MARDPDLHFCGFSLWVDNRQFPEARDYWDGNWLFVRARMEASGARVECSGPILMTTDIDEFRGQLAMMVHTTSGEATLKGLEPELDLVLRMQTLGHIEGTIEITADHLNQRHQFTVEADQSYLPALLRSCEVILERFPITNTDKQG
jgi:hypothetical protein